MGFGADLWKTCVSGGFRAISGDCYMLAVVYFWTRGLNLCSVAPFETNKRGRAESAYDVPHNDQRRCFPTDVRVFDIAMHVVDFCC